MVKKNRFSAPKYRSMFGRSRCRRFPAGSPKPSRDFQKRSGRSQAGYFFASVEELAISDQCEAGVKQRATPMQSTGHFRRRFLPNSLSLATPSVRAAETGPEYFEQFFPKETFPLYGWPARPSGLPIDVWTTETTHRDGQQGGLPLTTEQCVQIYEILCRFTRNSGAIRQAEFFVYRHSDRDALREVEQRFASGNPIEPTTWIRASVKDVKLIQSLGIRESGLLASISDYHVFHKFAPGGRKQAASLYLDAVRMTLDNGLRPRLHLEDATRASFDFIRYFVDAVRELASAYPRTLRPKFRVCDTLGLGLPDADVPAPRGIPHLFRGLISAGLEPSDLEFHPHNDTGLITANCLAAVRNGCGAINGTCLGKGERTGNAPLELVIMHLIGMGFFCRSVTGLYCVE
jgi:hypothetical protein